MSNDPNDKNALPKGSHQQTLTSNYTPSYHSDPFGYGLYGWTYPVPSDHGYTPETTQQAAVKCECGVHITYGPDAPPEFHTEGCPLYKGKPVV